MSGAGEPAPALAVRGISKSYGANEAVRGISFAIAPGECVGLLGPNGAGKSTTIQLCLGAAKQDAGDIRLLGFDMPAGALRARARVGVVPQRDNLDPDFSCAENLIVYGGYFGMARRQIDVPRLLQFAGLDARAGDRITTLSGGMQRRLTLARALVNAPDFIFLDEPTTGLDPQARHLIWERLHRLREEGKTLLLTTHFMEEAERLCGRVYIMDGGRIVAGGHPAQLVRDIVEPAVVEVYGDGAGGWLAQNKNLYARAEQFGRLFYCYSADAAPLIKALQAARLRFNHRPANLEDAFLALTGRALRE